MNTENSDSIARGRALAILFLMPLFFSSNIIFGRSAVAEVHPFTLAFLRWSLTAILLAPFFLGRLKGQAPLIRAMSRDFLLMGFLGMWICGAIVYLGLKYTSATNGTLIYTSSPVMIILIEWLFRGRKVGWREAIGVTLAFAGVVFIVVKGSIANLIALKFNIGDLLFVASAFSWAVYSVRLKSRRFSVFSTMPLFMLIAASGALVLAPFALVEIAWTQAYPATATAWFNISGIVLVASLLAFSAYQFGVAVLGASVTGIFLYLLPVYGVGMAVLFLGEELRSFHLWGIALVLGGVILATIPKRFFPF